ncbi:MAG TPA: aspartate-semialdehyde dehydrogenase [Kiloniellales bacterium]|nr:aspartate-semialdehyde dehydrogenase [Kiloniellales bacterium]
MSSSPLAGANVAILGATGAVGQELITVLRRRAPDLGSLTCYASARGGKRRLQVEGEEVTVLPYSREAIAADTLVFMAVSGDFSRTEAPALVERGALVIDNSSAFRYDPEVPLVVPEVNGDAVAGARLISNPNCTTSILVPALAALHKGFGLKRVIVSTYQAASGAGAAGMEELQQGVARQLAGEPVPAEAFVHPLAFNVIPHIDSFQENGYTREEMKVVLEGRKILGLPELPMSCTAVRVPTLRAHGEAVTVETEAPCAAAQARRLLAEAPGLEVVDDVSANRYPMPITATGKDLIEVGRIRQSLVFGERGIDFFLVGDQLRKGAALNGVQIAETVARSGSLKRAA